MNRIAIGDLLLASGVTLPNAEVAYQAFGKLEPDGRNAVLVTHGLTSGPQMLLPSDSITGEGTWADLVGPGAAIDTDRFFVVCPNMLGSSYGSTGPSSINPDTGKQYGPEFPELSVSDMVASQFELLRKLGVTHLRSVVGPSYGGIQALQWAIDFPDMMDSIGVVVSGACFPSSITPASVQAVLESDVNWNGGWYYDNGGLKATLKQLRQETLRSYGMPEVLADQGFNKADCETKLEELAECWAEEFDGNSLVTLCKAGAGFNAIVQIPHIKARILWVISKTDKVFPPNEEVRTLLSGHLASGRPTYVEIDSNYGHVASGADYKKWHVLLKELLA